MNLYTYTDNNKSVIVAEIQANCILEADKILEENFGINPIKSKNIGCSIKFNISYYD